MKTSHKTPFPHDLTISLIVKNEEDHLPACLKALSPLREALSCQLIVTDTGSTDATRDIALQYADLVLDFPWCDDFSKARNHAISQATGRWFFYLDADEVCDPSIQEIIPFLQSPESHSLGAVTVIQRNYQTPPAPPYSDLQTPRLINFGKGRRFFEGIIHESIAIHKGAGMLPVILHHSGYLAEHCHKKQNRNTPLLQKEVENHPEDIRTYVHLIQDLSLPEEKATWIEKARSVIQQNPSIKQQFFYPALLIEQARLSLTTKDPQPLAQAGKALLEDASLSMTQTLPHLEYLGLELDFLLDQNTSHPVPSSHISSALVAYHHLYQTLAQRPDRTYHGILSYVYAEPYHYARLLLSAMEQLKQQGAEITEWLTQYKGYQWQQDNLIYPFLPKTTYLCMALDLLPKLQEILLFLKEHGPEKDLRDFSLLLKEHCNQTKGTPPSPPPTELSPSPFSHELTISLIVKNEASTLASCLKALSPLREALSCQLIITDTGSTDGTQDIAKEYADLFLEFDWCSDFSKARNHAIPHATGRWFFYLDADEICDETLLQVATFLRSPHSHSIGSATLSQRNYQGETKNLSCYSDASVARLVNFGRGKRYFEGIIHESIPVHRDSQILPVVLHHEGYLHPQAKKKEGRNKTLLLQVLQAHPHQLEHYPPLLRELTSPEEKIQCFQQAFAVVEELDQGRTHYAFPSLLLEKARFAFEEKQPSLLEEATALLLATPNLLQTLPHLELLGLTLRFKKDLSAPVEELLPLFTSYRTLFLALEKNPDTQYPLTSVFHYHTTLAYHSLELDMVDALKDSPLLEGGRALLHATTGYQVTNQQHIYPLLPRITALCLDRALYSKLDEILAFLKKQGAIKDFMDVTHLFTTHLKQKGVSPT